MKSSLSTSSAPHIPAYTDLVSLLQSRAITYTDKCAFGLLDKGLEITESCTYAELDQDARRIAVALQAKGLTGQRALLMYPSSISFIRAFFGCLYAGVVPVPLYPPQMGAQIKRITAVLMDAQPRICLGHSRVLAKIESSFASEWAATGLELLDTDQLVGDPEAWKKPAIDPDALAFLQYTSGSTGQPKGVVVSHRNLLHNARLMSEALKTEPGELVAVGWLPLFHDMGLIGHVIKPLYVAGTSYIMSPMSFLSRPVAWLEAISRYRATHSGAPNFAYARCAEQIEAADLAGLDLRTWNRAYCGAEPVQAETMQRFAAKMMDTGFSPLFLTPCYGMAETTLMISSKPFGTLFKALSVDRDGLTQGSFELAGGADPEPAQLVSCGKPYGGLSLRIVDQTKGTVLPEGIVGEIWVQGESVAGGYFRQAEQTTHTFMAELPGESGNWLRTGDLGVLYEEELYVAGRAKDMIIIRGRNYYPQDIEQTSMEAHPALQTGGTVAFGVEQADVEALIVVQELQRNALRNHDAAAITQAIRQAIVEVHEIQPQTILLVPRRTIPKTSSGKVQRRACKATFMREKLTVEARWDAPELSADANRTSQGTQAAAGPSDAEDVLQWILQWVSAQTGESIDRLDADDSVQAYGIDSMQLGAFEGELGAYLAHNWPVNDFLLREPSLRELAAEAWRQKQEA